MQRVLIVKTSSLGDILQAFSVIDALEGAEIHWAVEPAFADLVRAHPKIHKTIPIARTLTALRELRQVEYDVVFDLQGNSKSAVVTALSRAKVKVGYGRKSVREWPNILATHVRFEVDRGQNIRTFYLELLERYFKRKLTLGTGSLLSISEGEKSDVEALVQSVCGTKIMVCPGSRWPNKQLAEMSWIAFLEKIDASFFLVWGNAAEFALCKRISAHLPKAILVEKLSVPAWQHLMTKMDLVIALDSAALHLCATTETPSYSLFGPTMAECFKPLGEKHISLQGRCPYGKSFLKQCPIMRSCPTGACIKNISSDLLIKAISSFFLSVK